jgi:release factor glutamine methyltransferase
MSKDDKLWKVTEIIKTTESIFNENKIKSARLNAELLLSKVLNCSRIDLYLNFDKPLTKEEINQYRELVRRRLKKEPLQYIIGKTEFYGLDFGVNPSVLIPRQETELIVELTLDYIKNKNLHNPKILDIGTGSGCIACSVSFNTECNIDAIDINPDAIKTAIENASRINLKGEINFSVKDFCKEFISFNGYDIIVSNPPYISKKDFENLDEEIKNYEPYEALTDSGDGFSFFKKIFETSDKTENKIKIFLEISAGAAEKIKDLLKDYSRFSYKFYNDISGIPRVLEINN